MESESEFGLEFGFGLVGLLESGLVGVLELVAGLTGEFGLTGELDL